MKNPSHYPSFSDLEEALVEDDSTGFCLSCGEQAFGVEPDARRYVCESCGASEVYGAEECMVMGAYAELNAGRAS